MKNYGEVLAYWYFRLNGFIPMTDFVLHGDEELESSDCDLIAVRFPHVWEAVGGQETDWDNDLLQALGHDGEKTLGVFLQVKTGEDDGNRVGKLSKYFSTHLEYLVQRLGFWEKGEASHVAERFQQAAVLPRGNIVLAKMVILRNLRTRRKTPEWIEWRLEDIVQFVYQRMAKYSPDKFTDRMHFPDPIIQFFAEQAEYPKYRWPNKDDEPMIP